MHGMRFLITAKTERNFYDFDDTCFVTLQKNRVIELFEGLSILLRGGLEGLPLFLMEFLRGWFEGLPLFLMEFLRVWFEGLL